MTDPSAIDRERLALDLFLDALEHAPHERGRFLDLKCGNDPVLRRRVGALLAADHTSLGLMDAAEQAARSALAQQPADYHDLPETADLNLGPHAGAPASKSRVEKYEIRALIARGGMGVVHLAFSLELRRYVALKIVRDDSRSLGMRFLDEAKVLAQLQHPNIVPVFDFGFTSDGLPFYTMPVVRGRMLADILRELRSESPQAWREALPRLLGIFLQTTQAVAYAHTKGVLHRDLKPSNIMLGEHGEVQVLDWGLAKVFARPSISPASINAQDEAELDVERTRRGTVAGTIAYMSPEQARGEVDRLTVATDVYSLGAILYEIVGGRPCVEGDHPTSMLKQVAEGRIEWPASRFPERRISWELDQIVRRAMASAPEARHPSADDLARAISDWMEGRVVKGLRYRVWQELWKWVRRNKALVTIAAASLAVLIGLGVFSVWNLIREKRLVMAAEAREVTQREAAEDSLARSRYSESGLLAQSGRHREAAERLDDVARNDRRQAVSRLAVDASRWALFQEGLDAELLTFEGHAGRVNTAAFFADGKTAVSGGDDGTLKIWDVRTGRIIKDTKASDAPIESMVVTADGSQVAFAAHDGTARLWSVREAREIDVIPERQNGTPIAISRNGRLLGLVRARSGSVCVGPWSGDHGPRCFGPPPEVSGAMAFSPDGRVLVSGHGGRFTKGTLGVWDVASGKLRRNVEVHGDLVRFAAFSPDGRTLFSGSEDTTLKLWEFPEFREVRTFSGHSRGVKCGALSPDGRMLLSGSFDRTLRLFDVSTGSEIRRFSGHAAQINAVAVSPDGRLALTAAWDGYLKLWDLTEPRPFSKIAYDQATVSSVCVSGDGRRALCGHNDGVVRLWDLGTGRLLRVFETEEVRALLAALSGDGRRAIAALPGGAIVLWDVVTGTRLRRWALSGGSLTHVEFSPDGTEVAGWDEHGAFWRWMTDAAGPARWRSVESRGGVVAVRGLSPDWRRALIVLDSVVPQTLAMLDMGNGAFLWERKFDSGAVGPAVFLPGGRRVLLGTADTGRLVCLDEDTGGTVWEYERPGSSIGTPAVSGDGRHAVVPAAFGPMLVDLQGPEEIRTLTSDDVTYEDFVSFLPGARSLLAAGKGIRMWDLAFAEKNASFKPRLHAAREKLAADPGDGEALNTFGEYYAFRGHDDWAFDFLSAAKAARYPVSDALFASVLWRLGKTEMAASLVAEALRNAPDVDRPHLELWTTAPGARGAE